LCLNKNNLELLKGNLELTEGDVEVKKGNFVVKQNQIRASKRQFCGLEGRYRDFEQRCWGCERAILGLEPQFFLFFTGKINSLTLILRHYPTKGQICGC